MVSRRRILSRSRDDLHHMEPSFQSADDEDDVWHHQDKLYKDHIQEVLDKWTQIDDEIWAKVIVLERNRRVAKAYARAPVLTVNGSDDGFDGFRIGLCGFENPMRDQKTEECKQQIGHGVKLKMDDAGNILIKRLAKSNVYIKNTAGQSETENAIGSEILKSLPNCALEPEKPVKLFDMRKFQANVNRELRCAYPDRRRLECQCLSAIAFVRSEPDVLACPIWVLIINVVAMDMLKSKLPPVQRRVVDIRNRPRIPIPDDEDPYSIAGIGNNATPERTSGFGGAEPPKLPPREYMYPHDIPKPDYDDAVQRDNASRLKPFVSSRSKGKSPSKKDSAQKYDDPYYCGFRARVPNFVAKSKVKDGGGPSSSKRYSSVGHGHYPQQPPSLPPISHQMNAHSMNSNSSNKLPPQSSSMWHTRSFESGIDSDAMASSYNQIYGRLLPIPTRTYIPNYSRNMFIGDWD